MPAESDPEGFAQRIRWPDGPVCPYCGERERMVPESRSTGNRVRYECAACERHRGYFRRPGGSSGGSSDAGDGAGAEDSEEPDEVRRRPMVPRFLQ